MVFNSVAMPIHTISDQTLRTRMMIGTLWNRRLQMDNRSMRNHELEIKENIETMWLWSKLLIPQEIIFLEKGLGQSNQRTHNKYTQIH